MALKPKVKVQIFKCKTCKKPYNNPLTHVCVIRMDRRRKPRKPRK